MGCARFKSPLAHQYDPRPDLGGPAAPPDHPRVLALLAIATMQLRAIEIGIVPEPQAGSVGIIGLPTGRHHPPDTA